MKILNELTIKHLKMNKKRTIVTIIGIILSTALMVGIGLLFSTLQDNAIRTTKLESGDYHILINEISSNKLDILENNHNVKKYYYINSLGFSENKEDGRAYYYIGAASETYFEQIKVIKGNIPTNSNEIIIPSQLENETGISYQIGDEIILPIGPRVIDGEEIYQNSAIDSNVEETLKVNEEKKYTVVGIMETPPFDEWNSAGYMFLTLENKKINTEHLDVYITFKKPSKAYQDTVTLMKNLGFSDVEVSGKVEYNTTLLALYGASKYDNIMGAIINILMIILTLVSIGCIIVIYNSFAISVMERKKQFGLFSSIGATKKQLRHTVFFEAFIVGIIGIPLGVLSSFIGIGIVVAIINYLIPGLFGINLVLTAYPTFLIIPIIFMIVTILASAYIPAYKASKITPIEAIRLNDDIKIKNRKLKTGKWVSKLFGIEGEIALKNIKRNKKKYRITIISLFISIVLFISFSTFVEYGLKTSSDTLNIPDFDILLRLDEPTVHNYTKFMNDVRSFSGVEDSIVIKNGRAYSTSYSEKEFYEKSLFERFGNDEEFLELILVSLDDENYKNYLNELGLKEERPILINKTKYIDYSNNSRKVYNVEVVNDSKKNYSFDLCEFKPYDERENNYSDKITKDEFVCTSTLNDVYVTDKIPFAVESALLGGWNIIIIIPEKTFNELYTPDTNGYYDEYSVYLKAPNYKKVDEYITEYIESNAAESNIHYFNQPKDMKLVNNLYLVIGILLYGFITLVTLIGVTSVFNTINTSIALRRKEFAMLRSMGLTPHGFNKILYFESFFFGVKSLLYGIPFSFLVISWIHVTMMRVSSFGEIMIPWKSVGIAVLAVFIIVFMTMMYATKKMKKENILDAIREENI